MGPSSYDGVLFDLFSALLDSQPAYDEVAGSAALGSRWRSEHSRRSYLAGDYRPPDALVPPRARSSSPAPRKTSQAPVELACPSTGTTDVAEISAAIPGRSSSTAPSPPLSTW